MQGVRDGPNQANSAQLSIGLSIGVSGGLDGHHVLIDRAQCLAHGPFQIAVSVEAGTITAATGRDDFLRMVDIANGVRDLLLNKLRVHARPWRFRAQAGSPLPVDSVLNMDRKRRKCKSVVLPIASLERDFGSRERTATHSADLEDQRWEQKREGEFGGRWRLRTSDPSSVNAVLYP